MTGIDTMPYLFCRLEDINVCIMPEYLNSFIHLVFIGFVALFPVVNPVGTAFIVNPYFTSLSQAERLSAVKKITFYAFLIVL